MAAYAALVSLMNNMEQIQNHPRLSTSLNNFQIESLGEKVVFFLDFIESYNSHGVLSKEAEDLESQIASAAHAAEDVIESHIVDQILAGSTEKSPSVLLHLQKIKQDIKKKVMKVQKKIQSKVEKSRLQKVMKDMDSIKIKIMKIEKKGGFKDQQPTHPMPTASSTPLTTTTITMVGFDGYLMQLLEGLTGQKSDRQIIPIVGMGGIGKTTLARNVYENSLTVQHFDVRAWVTVSQQYSVEEIVLETLSCLGKSSREMDKKTVDDLGEQLHKILFGRRYLIILDDMWSIEAWKKIQFFFPDNCNRSRIIVTTRLSDVASHFGSLRLEVNFLDDDTSWDLFCEKAFAQEGCPPGLEEIGKEIVKKCKGLPLAIVVIGGLLGKSFRKQKLWENVAKDMSSILNSAEDNQCSNILSLSYSHLPACLKPCFLYLGIFPEDHEIRLSRLIKLWVAEGFLKPNKYQSLEEIAEGYIKDLVDRNLILVRRLGSNGKLKTCYIHDLLRDLCTRVAEKEKFFCVARALDTHQDIDRECRIVIHESITEGEYPPRVFHTLKPTSKARSLICEGGVLSFKSRLLRVLIEVYTESLDTTFQQVNLRFLAYESNDAPIDYESNDARIDYESNDSPIDYESNDSPIDRIGTYELPSSISLLWNVQTLIITGLTVEVVAPSEIWEMPQLRHLKFCSICLPDPPLSDEKDGLVLRNLQTLGTVLNFRCSKEVCKRMPNIKKLSINYLDVSGEGETSSCYCLYNVGCLNKLESLNYSFGEVPNRDDLLQNLMFPCSLKKLTLNCCELHWNDLTIIGLLPHLEVLKLDFKSVTGPTWNPVEGEFLRLKFLGIYWCDDLIYWNADSSHFPVLEKLVLGGMGELFEIPSGIGDIPTLRVIYLSSCRVSTAISAIKILEEQESLGNEGLQVQVEFWNMKEEEKFREKVEVEGLTCRNFQIIPFR